MLRVRFHVRSLLFHVRVALCLARHWALAHHACVARSPVQQWWSCLGHPQPPDRSQHGCTVGVNRDPPECFRCPGSMASVAERQPYVRRWRRATDSRRCGLYTCAPTASPCHPCLHVRISLALSTPLTLTSSSSIPSKRTTSQITLPINKHSATPPN